MIMRRCGEEALDLASFIARVRKNKPAFREFAEVLCGVLYQHHNNMQ